jgi:hypothetical protein
VNFHVTGRTYDFACTCLVTEVLAAEPYGRVWVANHFPDYQLDHERERRLQSAAAARELESLVAEYPGHVIVAGDMDADDADLESWPALRAQVAAGPSSSPVSVRCPAMAASFRFRSCDARASMAKASSAPIL